MQACLYGNTIYKICKTNDNVIIVMSGNIKL